MAIIKKPGFGSGGRYRSGKLLRQVLGTTVYSWKPTPPDYVVKNSGTIESSPEKECCEICNGLTIDNCVTYVNGGSCNDGLGSPPTAAYGKCDYVV